MIYRNFSVRKVGIDRQLQCNHHAITLINILITFNNHINNFSGRISRSVGLLYKLDIYLLQEVLLKIYLSLIHPYFNYAMEAWFDINNNYSSNT